MALLNRFVLLVDYLIELICIFFIELTFNFFSFSCFDVHFFPPAWTYQIAFASLLLAPVLLIYFLFAFIPL